jgi:hypothetical protein
MISVRIDKKVNELQKALGDQAPKRLKKEVSAAVNAAAKRTQNLLAKEVSKELATSQKVIKEGISVTKKATPDNLAAEVTQKESQRLSLKRFGAQQTKTGVRYKISKTQGRKFVKSAFMPEALGQHVYQRQGKSRLPIQKLHGPSPWGITVKNQLDKLVTSRDIEPELIKQLDRQIKAVNFKKSQGQ